MFSKCAKSIFISVFCFFSVTCYAEEMQEKKLYHLQECIELAKQNNQAVVIATAKIEAAIAGKQEARSAFLPSIDLEALYTNNTKSLSGDLTQFQDFHSSTAVGITVNQDIWDFGFSLNRFRASKVRIDSSKIQKEYALLVLEEQVRTAYMKTLEREKYLILVKASIRSLEQELSLSKSLHEQEILRKTDLLSIELQLAEKKQVLMQAQNEIDASRLTLNQLIGIPLTQKISLQDVEKQSFQASSETLVQSALRSRPDLVAMRKNITALELERRSAKLSIAPKIFGFANGNVSIDDKEAAASVGIGLKMDLYEGGSREAKIHKIDSQIKELKATLEEAEQLASVHIQNTLSRIEELETNLLINEQAISLGEENLQSYTKLYQQGLASVHDVLISTEKLYKAQTSYYTNLYQAHIAYARLLTLTGGLASK